MHWIHWHSGGTHPRSATGESSALSRKPARNCSAIPTPPQAAQQAQAEPDSSELLANVAEPADESQYHVVARGDTLSAIARTYYGNASQYPKIFKANRPMLSHPDKIYP